MVSLLKACETANIKKGAGPMLRPWKFSLSRDIDPHSETPIYLQVVHALIQDIRRGRLLPGTILPSTRAMADTLGVNRKTIALAYDDLVAQGWLETGGTRGTFVSDRLPEPFALDAPGGAGADSSRPSR
jgi:GntR family transcriptional regulator/MocR family aminotransferase